MDSSRIFGMLDNTDGVLIAYQGERKAPAPEVVQELAILTLQAMLFYGRDADRFHEAIKSRFNKLHAAGYALSDFDICFLKNRESDFCMDQFKPDTCSEVGGKVFAEWFRAGLHPIFEPGNVVIIKVYKSVEDRAQDIANYAINKVRQAA